MKIVQKFHEELFWAKESKKAYLRACRWIAENVVGKLEEIGETTYKIIKTKYKKDEETKYPAFVVELYCTINEKELRTDYCNLCKSFHRSVFISTNFDCSKCNLIGYMERVEGKVKIIQKRKKQKIDYLLDREFRIK